MTREEEAAGLRDWGGGGILAFIFKFYEKCTMKVGIFRKLVGIFRVFHPPSHRCHGLRPTLELPEAASKRPGLYYPLQTLGRPSFPKGMNWAAAEHKVLALNLKPRS